MKIKTLFSIMIITSLILSVSSCKKDDSDETKISQHSGDESHNNGENCMNCHKSGGEGEGSFTLAGSAYDSSKQTPYPNATIKLYSEANGSGTLIKTIEVDGKGNFYTTENIDFGSGLYVNITGTSQNIKNMISKITSGNCNSCHGVSTDKIWAE